LESLTEGDELSTWVETGQVSLGKSAWKTGGQGRGRFVGAPEWFYRRSPPPVSDGLSGQVEPVGGEVAEVTILVP
jgi:hypothetical protein